jgi:hypothetical protein
MLQEVASGDDASSSSNFANRIVILKVSEYIEQASLLVATSVESKYRNLTAFSG